MIKEALAALLDATQTLKRTPMHLLIFAALYFLLLVACYLFITTREASIWQLLLTALAAIAAPMLFFLIQAASVNYMRTPGSVSSLLRRAAGDLPKLVFVTIPLILLGVGLLYLINELQAQYPVPPPKPLVTNAIEVEPPVPFAWSEFIFFALRIFLFGILLPLLTIHTWLSIARCGLGGTLKGFFRVLRAAFSACSILIYTFGLLVFAALPYFLIFTRTAISNPWAELFIFGARLLIVFALTLFGWIVTVGALAKINYDEQPQPTPDVMPTASAPAVVPLIDSAESAPATP